MTCGNHPTRHNVREIIDWRPVPSDKRYEEKLTIYKSGRVTRMTRVTSQPSTAKNPEYPHYTEMYDAKGKKELEHTHYSTDEGDSGKHTNAHKTAQAILDDLDEAIRSLKANR